MPSIRPIVPKFTSIKDNAKSRNTGLVLVLAALGMMSGLLAVEVKELGSWTELTNPKFIAALLGHISTVIGAYIAGRLTPENRNQKRTRQDD